MAITLSTAPSGNYLTTGNKNIQLFTFTASASETWLQLRLNDGTSNYELQPIPFVGGTASIDLAPYFASVFNNDDNTDNSRSTISADMPTFDFTIEQRNSANNTYASIGSTYTVVNAARQIGKSANLTDYEATIDGSNNVTSEGALLTLRERPTVFWYSDSETPTTSAEVSVWQQQLGFLNPYSDNTRAITVQTRWYKGGVLQSTVNRTEGRNREVLLYIFGAESDVYNADRLEYEILDAATGGTITLKTFDLVRACINPVAVKWLNSLGIWETYVFQGNAPISSDINEEGLYDKPITDLATATGTARAIFNKRNDEIEVFADNLTFNEASALLEILTSPNVLLFTGELTAGTAFDEWQEVVASGSPTLDKRQARQSVTFTLRKPDYLTQRN